MILLNPRRENVKYPKGLPTSFGRPGEDRPSKTWSPSQPLGQIPAMRPAKITEQARSPKRLSHKAQVLNEEFATQSWAQRLNDVSWNETFLAIFLNLDPKGAVLYIGPEKVPYSGPTDSNLENYRLGNILEDLGLTLLGLGFRGEASGLKQGDC